MAGSFSFFMFYITVHTSVSLILFPFKSSEVLFTVVYLLDYFESIIA